MTWILTESVLETLSESLGHSQEVPKQLSRMSVLASLLNWELEGRETVGETHSFPIGRSM